MTTGTPSDPAEILRGTRDRLTDPRRYGAWIKGDLDTPRGRDVIGHMRAVARPGPADKGDPRPYVAARALLARALPEGPWSVASFNDHPGTTLDHMLTLLDRAIALADDAGPLAARRRR